MARTISVSNSAELYGALANARGGDVISLASGNYGELQANRFSKFNLKFDSKVTIKSADPGNPAVFTELNLRDAGNITFDSVKFDYTYKAGDALWYRPFSVGSSSNIAIVNSVFNGDVARNKSPKDDGFGFAIGMTVRDSKGVLIENNEFSGFHRGFTMQTTSDAQIVGNELHSMRAEGINLAAVQNTVVENNYIHNFRGSLNSSDHRDMIQVWTDGTTRPTTNLTIRGNTLDIGAGSFTQSIFMRNELVDRGTAGYEMFYRDILIENNVIYNAHLNAISVGAADGLTIRNNSVLQAKGDGVGINLNQGVNIPRINVAPSSFDVTVEKNVTSDVFGERSGIGWSVKDNVFVQNNNANKPGFYADVFISTSLDPKGGVHSYIVRPGSLIDTLNAGADRLQFDGVSPVLRPLFDVSTESSTGATVFDASFSAAATGLLNSGNATFIWDFGDGNTAEGVVVKHLYSTASTYPVTLHVVTKAGNLGSFRDDVGIEGGKILSLSNVNGRFYSHGFGEAEMLMDGGQKIVGTPNRKGIDLGGIGTQAKIDNLELDDLFGSDNFRLSMKLQADSRSAGVGEIVRLHMAFAASVDRGGNVEFQIYRPDGSSVKIKTAGVAVNDTRLHDITVDYSNAEGELKIFIDGALAGSGNFTGKLPAMGALDLSFGNPWGGRNFDGRLMAFDLSVEGAAHPTSPGGVVQDASTEINQMIKDALAGYGHAAPVQEAGMAAMFSAPVADRLAAAAPAPAPDAADVPAAPDFVLDFAELAADGAEMLKGDARLEITAAGPVVRLDGNGDYIDLGRLTQFEQSEKISFSVEFNRDVADASNDRLVSNHQKVALNIAGDGLILHVATAAEGFKSFGVKNLGLNDTDTHSAVVMIDADEDLLQVFVDGALVLEETGTDFDFVGAGGREAGWMIGTPWSQFVGGDISDFHVSDSFSFVDTSPGSLSPV